MTGFNSKREAAADKDALFQKFEVVQPVQEPVSGAYLNSRGGVTLCAHGHEKSGFGFVSNLYATLPAPLPVQEPEREALKLALGALETCGEDEWHSDDDYVMVQIYNETMVNRAITAIKEVLAQLAQEPVAWADLQKKAQQIVESKFLWKRFIDGTPLANDIACWMADFARQYTPPPQRQWIWLSDTDIAEVVDTTCQYTGSYEEFLIKKAERKIRSMNT